jgi:hypothetical protein
MTEVVDGRTDQMIEDAFTSMLDEDPLDHDDVLEGIRTEGGEDDPLDAQAAPRERSAGTPNPDTGTVVSRLASDDPEAHAVVSNMQRDMSRMHNEWHELRESTLQAREDLISARERLEGGGIEEAAEDETGLPANVTEDHLDMFKKMADHFGYIPRDVMESEDEMAVADNHSNDQLVRGVEEWGDSFGTVEDNGEVSINPDLQGRISDRIERLTDSSEGITPYDVNVLLMHEAGINSVPAAREQSYARQPTNARSIPNSSANTIRRSTGASERVKIYTPGDDAGDVIDRAFALTTRELGR